MVQVVVLVLKPGMTSVVDLVSHVSAVSDRLVVTLKRLVKLSKETLLMELVLLKSVMHQGLVIEKWLDVDIAVKSGATLLLDDFEFVLGLVSGAEGLSMVDTLMTSKGVLREVMLTKFSERGLVVSVAHLTTMERLVVFLVLGLLNEEVMEQGSLKVFVFVLVSVRSVVLISGSNIEVASHCVTLGLKVFDMVRLGVVVVESVMDGVLMEVNGLNIMLIVELMVQSVMILMDSVHSKVAMGVEVRVVKHLASLVVLSYGMVGDDIVCLNLVNQVLHSSHSHILHLLDSFFLFRLSDLLLFLVRDDWHFVMLSGDRCFVLNDRSYLMLNRGWMRCQDSILAEERLMSVVSVVGLLVTVVNKGRLVMLLLLMEKRNDLDVVIGVKRDLMDDLFAVLTVFSLLTMVHGSLMDGDLELLGTPVAAVHVVILFVSLMMVMIVETIVKRGSVLSGPEVGIRVVSVALLVLVRSLIVD